MENTTTTITFAILTGLLTSVLGAIVWEYWLKRRIDQWLDRRARRHKEDEKTFQKLVEQLVDNPRLEDDFTMEALFQLINVRVHFTRSYIWLAVFILLLTQIISQIASSQITLFSLIAFGVYALFLAVDSGRLGAKSEVRLRKIWNAVIGARLKQEDRGPHYAETIDKMGSG